MLTWRGRGARSAPSCRGGSRRRRSVSVCHCTSAKPAPRIRAARSSSIGKVGDRSRKIRVRRAVAAHERADARQQVMEVEVVDRANDRRARRRELEDHEARAGREHAIAPRAARDRGRRRCECRRRRSRPTRCRRPAEGRARRRRRASRPTAGDFPRARRGASARRSRRRSLARRSPARATSCGRRRRAFRRTGRR